jgi:hypothetical protein
MFEQIPERRPGAVGAAWFLQISRARQDRVGRFASVRRMNAMCKLGHDPAIVTTSNGQVSSELTASGWLRLTARLAAWVFRIGEKLVRWKLASMHYPLD